MTRPGQTAERFRRSADEQARLAATATLPMVRERCLDAEQAFLAMAARAEAVDRDMVERAAAVVPKGPRIRARRFGQT